MTSFSSMISDAQDQLTLDPPINISDAIAMLKRSIHPNEKPYTEIVLRKNNMIIDNFYDSILLHKASINRTMSTNAVCQAYKTFVSGLHIREYVKYREYMPLVTEEQVRYWIDFFTGKTIEQLYAEGSITVMTGWNILKSAVQEYFCNEEWNLVFSQSTDPLVCDRLRNSQTRLVTQYPLPYDMYKEQMQDIAEKVQIITNTPISMNCAPDAKLTLNQVKDTLKAKIQRNDRPYSQAIMTANNELIDTWFTEVFSKRGKKKKGKGTYIPSEIYTSINCYIERKELANYMKHFEYYPRITEEQLSFWISFFKANDIGDLHDRGITVVSIAWRILKTCIQNYFYLEKWNKIYFDSQTNTLRTFSECEYLLSSNPELMKGDTIPYDIPLEELNDYALKVRTVLTHLIEPE